MVHGVLAPPGLHQIMAHGILAPPGLHQIMAHGVLAPPGLHQIGAHVQPGPCHRIILITSVMDVTVQVSILTLATNQIKTMSQIPHSVHSSLLPIPNQNPTHQII